MNGNHANQNVVATFFEKKGKKDFEYLERIFHTFCRNKQTTTEEEVFGEKKFEKLELCFEFEFEFFFIVSFFHTFFLSLFLSFLF